MLPILVDREILGAVKQPPEMIEGQEASDRFDATLTHLLAVPRAEYLRREEEYKAKSLKNPNRRGPKPKVAKTRKVRQIARSSN